MATVATKKVSTLLDIAEKQTDKTEAVIKSAVDTFEKQLDDAREIGSAKGKSIMNGFGFDNKLGNNMSDMAGYMGEAAAAGMVMGIAPMAIMFGTAKGLYNKLTA